MISKGFVFTWDDGSIMDGGGGRKGGGMGRRRGRKVRVRTAA